MSGTKMSAVYKGLCLFVLLSCNRSAARNLNGKYEIDDEAKTESAEINRLVNKTVKTPAEIQQPEILEATNKTICNESFAANDACVEIVDKNNTAENNSVDKVVSPPDPIVDSGEARNISVVNEAINEAKTKNEKTHLLIDKTVKTPAEIQQPVILGAMNKTINNESFVENDVSDKIVEKIKHNSTRNNSVDKIFRPTDLIVDAGETFILARNISVVNEAVDKAKTENEKTDLLINKKVIAPVEIQRPVILEATNKTICNESFAGNDAYVEIVDKYEDNTVENNSEVKTVSPTAPIEDSGEALILTPFIKQGKTEYARNISRVDPNILLGVKSHSGFLTVDEKHQSNTFFWYFPVQDKDVENTPWIIWLQGGPGASSLIGLFEEMGPVYIDEDSILRINDYTWAKDHSLLFIDNPVGSGFSFTNHKDGYVRDTNTSANHLYNALQQFVQIFPELLRAPLYVAGESYAGKYVPALATEIHTHNLQEIDPLRRFNLQGIILGNAYTEPADMLQKPQLLYYLGLIDKSGVEVLEPRNDAFKKAIEENDTIHAKRYYLELHWAIMLLTKLKNFFNHQIDEVEPQIYCPFVNHPSIRKALHVGELQHKWLNRTVNENMSNDFISSSKPYIEKLLNQYRVLMYCGQLDLMVPCSPTIENHAKWVWPERDTFMNATRVPWTLDNDLVGYYKSGGGLTEVMVRKAGHMACADSPAAVLSLVTNFTHACHNTKATLLINKTVSELQQPVISENMNKTLCNESISANDACVEIVDKNKNNTTENNSVDKIVGPTDPIVGQGEALILARNISVVNEVLDEAKIENEKTRLLISKTAKTAAEIQRPVILEAPNKTICDESFAENDVCVEIVDNNENNTFENNSVNKTVSPIDQIEDSGEALMLTSFIQQGKIEYARNISRVDPNILLGIKSHSGFLTVDERHQSNTFFWYFPVQDKDVENSPWIIWLQGWPGGSSLIGLFEEMGPVYIDDDSILHKNDYSWAKDHSLLFIDNPVGSGFSFTNHKDGYVRDMNTSANHLYNALQQFVQIFPELLRAPLYIAGESYAGKYVPALATEIHTHNLQEIDPLRRFNLQGIILGNAYTEPADMLQKPQLLYYLGLIDKSGMKVLEPRNDAFKKAIEENDTIHAKKLFSELMSDIVMLTQQKNFFNHQVDDVKPHKYSGFVNQPIIRKALHVGGIEHVWINQTVQQYMEKDFLSSSKPHIEKLLNHYKVLMYCGQLDLMVPCSPAVENHAKWVWPERDSFMNATRVPWMLDNDLVGYYKSGGGLTEVMVRKAGSEACADSPAAVLYQVSLFTHDKPLPHSADNKFFDKLMNELTKSIIGNKTLSSMLRL